MAGMPNSRSISAVAPLSSHATARPDRLAHRYQARPHRPAGGSGASPSDPSTLRTTPQRIQRTIRRDCARTRRRAITLGDLPGQLLRACASCRNTVCCLAPVRASSRHANRRAPGLRRVRRSRRALPQDRRRPGGSCASRRCRLGARAGRTHRGATPGAALPAGPVLPARAPAAARSWTS